MGVHRSRYELERVLDRYGASDFALVEADASASIQFALEGRYVQVALPLPDPSAAHFTHTPSGRPRTVVAQERAYEQALCEHWRGLLLAVRGKLQSVESGISTFEDEFASFLVPHFHEQKTTRRKKPRAVNWLLGSSHSLAIALVATFLVPASAVGAFALPPNVVDQLAAPFRGALRDELAVPNEHARAVALGQSSWLSDETDSPGDRIFLRAERNFAVSAPQGDQGAQATGGGSASAPSQGQGSSGGDKQSGQSSSVPGGSGASAGQGGGEAASSGGGDPAAPSNDGPAADEQTSGADEESEAATGESAQPSDDSETPESGAESSNGGDGAPASDPVTDTESQPGDSDNGHDNGNHNGADNGNKNGADNGNKTDAPAPAAPAGDAGNGDSNGADKGKKADAPAGDKPKPGKVGA